jgi:hypothetical protein
LFDPVDDQQISPIELIELRLDCPPICAGGSPAVDQTRWVRVAKLKSNDVSVTLVQNRQQRVYQGRLAAAVGSDDDAARRRLDLLGNRLQRLRVIT